MAYRISATTTSDQHLLDQLRDLAWKERKDVSEVIREAFAGRLTSEDVQHSGRTVKQVNLNIKRVGGGTRQVTPNFKKR